MNEIIHGKWEDSFPKIESNSIDLIITSPPYNVDLGNNKNKKDAYAEYDDNKSSDEYFEWMHKLFLECNRVLKTGGRLCINIADAANGSVPTHVNFTWDLLNLFKSESANEPYQDFKMMTTIVWDKCQMGSSTAWGSWQSPSCPSFPTQFEYIIVVAKGDKRHKGESDLVTVTRDDFIRNSRALWTFPPETSMMKTYDHPAMFPEELPRRLIDQLSYKNDIVLDPFSGAGTTCKVAKEMGRRYIGFEMTEKYVDKSRERVNMVPEIIVAEDGSEVLGWLT